MASECVSSRQKYGRETVKLRRDLKKVEGDSVGNRLGMIVNQ